MVRLGVGRTWSTPSAIGPRLRRAPRRRPRRRQRPRPRLATRTSAALLTKGGWDPYLEHPATLWRLHYELAVPPERSPTWYSASQPRPQPEPHPDRAARLALEARRGRGWPAFPPPRSGAMSKSFCGLMSRGRRGEPGRDRAAGAPLANPGKKSAEKRTKSTNDGTLMGVLGEDEDEEQACLICSL